MIVSRAVFMNNVASGWQTHTVDATSSVQSQLLCRHVLILGVSDIEQPQ